MYGYNEIKEGYEEYQEKLEKFIKLCWRSKEGPKQELKDSEIDDNIKRLEENKAVGPDHFNNEMIERWGKKYERVH